MVMPSNSRKTWLFEFPRWLRFVRNSHINRLIALRARNRTVADVFGIDTDVCFAMGTRELNFHCLFSLAVAVP